MIIKELENTHGWKIEPQTSDEYQKIMPEIEALKKKFTNYTPDLDVQKAIDSLLDDLDHPKGR